MISQPPPPGYPPAHQPPPPPKRANPWMIIGWIALGSMLCGLGSCVAIIGITALGASSSTSTTVRAAAVAPATSAGPTTTAWDPMEWATTSTVLAERVGDAAVYDAMALMDCAGLAAEVELRKAEVVAMSAGSTLRLVPMAYADHAAARMLALACP